MAIASTTTATTTAPKAAAAEPAAAWTGNTPSRQMELVQQVIREALKGPNPLGEPARAVSRMRRYVGALDLPLQELGELTDILRSIAYRLGVRFSGLFDRDEDFDVLAAKPVPGMGCTRQEYVDAAAIACKACMAAAAARRVTNVTDALARLQLVLALPGALPEAAKAPAVARLKADISRIIHDQMPWHPTSSGAGA